MIKVFRKGFIFGIIILFVGASFTTNIFANSNVIYDKETDDGIIFLYNDDQLDQNQTMFWGTLLVRGSPDYVRYAQSFKPTLSKLSKIELLLYGGSSDSDGEIDLSIRSDLNGTDLTSVSIKANDILLHFKEWYFFDFSDISVTPEQSYYIVLQSDDYNTECWWCYGMNNYSRGDAWSQKDNQSWKIESIDSVYFDFCFKTYGFNDTAPSKPIINGPNTGKSDSVYSCSFIAVDPEDDNIFYEIDWGDGIVIPWEGPYESNEKISRTHVYLDKGEFTIMARAKDANGNIGDWGTLDVNIPKNKIVTNMFLQRFFQNHSYLLTLIQKLLNRLGQ
jgi:hypothetical protein